MLSRIGTAWRNAARDIVLIVVSILIAFVLDAWWNSLQDRQRLTRHLKALEHEFSVVRESLTADRSQVIKATNATRAILSAMGSSKPESFADSLAALLNTSYDVGVDVSQGGALSTILASADIRLIRDDSLAYLLARWPALVQEISSNDAILMASREQELRMRLITLGVPESAIASNIRGLDLPATRFRFHPNAVLLDAGVESMLVSRLIRLGILETQLESAIAHTGRILDRL